MTLKRRCVKAATEEAQVDSDEPKVVWADLNGNKPKRRKTGMATILHESPS